MNEVLRLGLELRNMDATICVPRLCLLCDLALSCAHIEVQIRTHLRAPEWYSETAMTRARGIAQAAELQKELNAILPRPSAGVVKWRHTFGNDWAGDPAIFFWVTLTDEASKKDILLTTTEAFRKLISERIDFQNDWDLFPYFNFRSESEQAVLNDEVYAQLNALIDQFFDHAVRLAMESGKTEQVDFRRAVSAAYYAVFHLLTMTASESWAVGRERHRFARLFEHGKLRTASSALPGKLKERLGDHPSPDDQETADTLSAIAKEFIALQQDRNSADYDNSRTWSFTEVEDVILRAHALYSAWSTVSTTPLAESYLLDMLGGK